VPAAAYIGRVGGLAIALGLGAAVATGQGVALADAGGSPSKDSASTASSGSPSGSATDGPAAPDPSPQSPRKTVTPAPTQNKKAPASTSGRPAAAGPARKGPATKKADPAPNQAAPSAAPEPVVTARRVTVDAATPEPPSQAPVTATVVPTAFAAPAVVAAPIEVSAPVAPKVVSGAIRTVVNGVLAAIGLGSPATSNSPVGPVESPVMLALMAFGTRRETAPTAVPLGASTLTAAPLAAAAVTTPVTTRIGWVTGANSINSTVSRFGIAGTDVGVMWDNGVTGDNPATAIVEQRQVLIAFGDTFSGTGMTGVWRNNVLLRSADNVLSNGLYVPNGIIHDPGAYSGSPMSTPNFSREIIGKYGYAVGPEVTIIPTAAISVPGAGANGATRQYVNFMSVRSWDTPGRWTTNYSGIIYSDDNGQNWTVVPRSSIRPAAAGRSTVPFIAGNQNFQQGAYVTPPAGSADAAAGWVYSYGTPAGRGGTVYVSRVNQYQLLDQTKYQYWNGSAWVANSPSAAKPILPGTTTAGFFGFGKTTTYPSVSEMSVQYNPYLKKYVMLYGDQNNNIVMRTSTTPQGTWSAPTTLVTSTQYPGLYAPMIHPWSGSSQLRKPDGTPEDPQYLYWNLSQWNEYNVALMRTDLSRV
jgi:hypothetical protein